MAKRRHIPPPPRRVRPAKYVRTDWQKWSQSHLSKSSKELYGITDPSKTSTPVLRKAYLRTQYNTLRRAGMGRHEARRVSATAIPQDVRKYAKDYRYYVDELVLRHRTPTSAKAWATERKAMRKYISKKSYSATQWERFSQFYGKFPKGKFETAGVRKEKRKQAYQDYVSEAKFILDTVKGSGRRKSKVKLRVEKRYKRIIDRDEQKNRLKAEKTKKALSEGNIKPRKLYRDKKGRFVKRKK
jgi:hypothetical protein